jgi:competence protein ComEC
MVDIYGQTALRIRLPLPIYLLLLVALLLIQCSKEITPPSNNAPYISPLPIQVAQIGQAFQDVSLDQYVQDEDPDSLISWTITDGEHISGTIERGVLHLTADDPSWTGIDVIILQATDTEGLSTRTSVMCQVVNMSAWENRNVDGTVTIVWSTKSISDAAVLFGTSPNHLSSESRSLLDPDTLSQVRLLGIDSDQIIYYRAINYDLIGNVVFHSPVDSFITGQVQPNDIFRATMIDVRQGDSFLLVSPSGKVIVIDGGYGTHQPSFGGEWSGDGYPFSLAYLQSQGIDHVDYMVETHHDMDHWGGLQDIRNAMSVDHYYSPDSPDSMEVGEPWDLHDPLLVARILSLDYPPDVPHSGDNNRSIVIRFEIGSISFLFTGDAEQEVELWEVATYGDELSSTVLKVGHHGSSSSSDPTFLNEVFPQIALISCGAGNPYGHPHDVTLESLHDVDATVYRTDIDGDVTIRTDGHMALEIMP